MEVRKIMCTCGSGLGSSLMVEMNVKDVLKKMGKEGIQVTHTTISDVNAGAADIFVVGRELESFIPEEIDAEQKVVLDNIMSKPELTEKLGEAFEKLAAK